MKGIELFQDELSLTHYMSFYEPISQPVPWLVQNYTQLPPTTQQHNNQTTRQLTLVQTEANETEAWFRGLSWHLTRKRINKTT